MIRPLKLEHMKVSGITFKNQIHGTHHVLNHMGDTIACGTVTDKHFWKKLLSHPITAFGYSFNSDYKDLPNPRFSKHDVIRALDFWIEHWVYQNQVESVLTGTVNIEHEKTLKEMILVREKVMKMPVKTKFTRARIRVNQVTGVDPGHNGKYFTASTFIIPDKKGKIVFTEAVCVEDSSATDPFCHQILEMTKEEYERDKIPWADKPISKINRKLQGLIQTHMNLALEAVSNTIIYENMLVGIEGMVFTDSNSFVTIPVGFRGNGTEINMDIFLTDNSIEELGRSMGRHTVQIRPSSTDGNFLEIDGQKYHTTNVSISHNPRRPFSMILRDLWIDMVNITAARHNIMDIYFLSTMGLTRTNISLTLHEPTDGAFMRQSFRNDEVRAWDLEILGDNRVSIGGDLYTVIEPIQIDFK